MMHLLYGGVKALFVLGIPPQPTTEEGRRLLLEVAQKVGVGYVGDPRPEQREKVDNRRKKKSDIPMWPIRA